MASWLARLFPWHGKQQQRHIKHHSEGSFRAFARPHRCLHFTTTLPPHPFHSFRLQLSGAGRSSHPRHPRAIIISLPSQPVALKCTPLPLSNNSSPTSTFSPRHPTHGGATWGRCQDIEDVLLLGFEPKEAGHTAGIWPRLQNVILPFCGPSIKSKFIFLLWSKGQMFGKNVACVLFCRTKVSMILYERQF